MQKRIPKITSSTVEFADLKPMKKVTIAIDATDALRALITIVLFSTHASVNEITKFS